LGGGMTQQVGVALGVGKNRRSEKASGPSWQAVKAKHRRCCSENLAAAAPLYRQRDKHVRLALRRKKINK